MKVVQVECVNESKSLSVRRKVILIMNVFNGTRKFNTLKEESTSLVWCRQQ